MDVKERWLWPAVTLDVKFKVIEMYLVQGAAAYFCNYKATFLFVYAK